MKKRTIDLLKKFGFGLLVFSLWIGVWEIFALIIGNSYFLPSPLDTLLALLSLMCKGYFYRVVFASFLRVLLGLAIGVALGIALGSLCHLSRSLKAFVSPIITVIKAMPVATFIILLWITMIGATLTVFIGVLMVFPIIFQNTLDGFDSIDKNLKELTLIYKLSFFRKLRLLILPNLISFIVSALITSVGLAFKAQIAAEIIAYTRNSIGQYIFDAKYNLNTAEVFAWAAVIVLFSIGIEAVTRLLARRVKDAA